MGEEFEARLRQFGAASQEMADSFCDCSIPMWWIGAELSRGPSWRRFEK
jgi:hypothetical protein